MRASKFLVLTQRDIPADAELVSHRLMVRAGLIRRVGAGIYNWLPLGVRVLRKVEAVVREEMNRIGGIELLMPALQPAELWQSSGRWEKYGPELMRLKDRHERDFCLGPTHEEVVTAMVGADVRSYKQLPINLYQIQTKFRDEVRPRFGVMRGREFIMKDAYSFHNDYACLEKTYQDCYSAYSRIFTRLGLQFRAVNADTGAIGGNHSHEFHVLAQAGEDLIAFCPQSDYAANVELCPINAPKDCLTPPAVLSNAASCETVKTPDIVDCQSVAAFLNININAVLKSLLFVAEFADGRQEPVLVLLRGDHEINAIKLRKYLGAETVELAPVAKVSELFNTQPGSLGPALIQNAASAPQVKIVADYAVMAMSDFACGANVPDYHYNHCYWGRDIAVPQSVADLRFAQAGDPSPDGKGLLELCRGIEVGHIFQLRTRYSKQMGISVLDAQGKAITPEMGCYGIGVTRVIASAIEQNFDDKGIKFPVAMAPFEVSLIPMQYDKSAKVKQATDALYRQLQNAGLDVFLDDRNERPGSMFADYELMGIPYRVVIGEKGLAENKVEFSPRATGIVEMLPVDALLSTLTTLIQQAKSIDLD